MKGGGLFPFFLNSTVGAYLRYTRAQLRDFLCHFGLFCIEGLIWHIGQSSSGGSKKDLEFLKL